MTNVGDYMHNQIRRFAQKVLFAEEFVNYVLQINSLPGILRSSERSVESGLSIFDNNFRMVADFLNGMCENYTKHIFTVIMDNNMNDIKWFSHYANSVKGKFSIYGSHPKPFLTYCVHLAQLAGKLCAQGIDKAPCAAGRCIVETTEFDLSGLGEAILDMIPPEKRRSSYAIEKPSSDEKENAFFERMTTETVQRKRLAEYIPVNLGTFQHINPYNVSSSSNSIGVSRSSRETPINLYSQQFCSSDLSEDENKHGKRPRLDPDI